MLHIMKKRFTALFYGLVLTADILGLLALFINMIFYGQ